MNLYLVDYGQELKPLHFLFKVALAWSLGIGTSSLRRYISHFTFIFQVHFFQFHQFQKLTYFGYYRESGSDSSSDSDEEEKPAENNEDKDENNEDSEEERKAEKKPVEETAAQKKQKELIEKQRK